MHETLLAKLGTPRYFESISFASYSVWENTKTELIYLFEHNYSRVSNGTPFEEGSLFIIDINDKVLFEKFTQINYNYYRDYMEKRTGKGKNYTYEEFAKEQNEDDDPTYLKAIKNPVKH